MKIAIIGCSNLRRIPFVYKYTTVLDNNNVDYVVINWNRECIDEKFLGKGIIHTYNSNLNEHSNKFIKLKSFLGFRDFIKQKLNEYKFDKLIILTTPTAVIIIDILLKQYKNKFVFDYRDVSLENIQIYKYLVGKLVNHSYFTAISSKGFLKKLPLDGKYVMSHNFDKKLLFNSNNEFNEFKHKKHNHIRLSFWGIIRHKAANEKIIGVLGNDDRFEVCYYGYGNLVDELKTKCDISGYTNIFFKGSYNSTEKEVFCNEADIIHNVYDNDFIMKPAISNKFYDSIIYNKPIIVSKGSYMGDIVFENGIGYMIDFKDKDIANKLFKWYNDFDWSRFNHSISNLKKEFLKDDNLFEKKILEFSCK